MRAGLEPERGRMDSNEVCEKAVSWRGTKKRSHDGQKTIRGTKYCLPCLTGTLAVIRERPRKQESLSDEAAYRVASIFLFNQAESTEVVLLVLPLKLVILLRKASILWRLKSLAEGNG